MNILNNWENPIARERLDIVFENRNHEYGAYVIRREYSRTVLFAFLSTFGFATLLIILPALWNLFHPGQPVKLDAADDVIYKFTEVILPEKEDVILPEQKEEKKLPETKPAGSEQFTNLKVNDRDTSNMKTQDQLLASNPGTKTIKSDSSTVVDPLPADPKPSGGGASKVFIGAEIMPAFPGGETEMMKFLQKNIKYPAEAREINLTGTVYLSFVVTSGGEISNVKVLRGIGGGCEEEAVRVVQKMPVWNPGQQNGNPVNVQFTLPVTFKLR